MRKRDEYDPGDLNAPQPRRRGRRFEDEYDDAWAAGDEDADYDDPAGSLWENPRYAMPQADDDDVSPALPRRRRYRSRRLGGPYSDSPPPRRGRARPDADYERSTGDPAYHRARSRQGEYGEYYEKPKRSYPPQTGLPGPLANIPFWQILMLVILGLLAFLAVMLACVSILTL